MSRISRHQAWLALADCIVFLFLAACQHTPGSPRQDIRTSTVNVAPEQFSLKQNEFAAFKVLVPADATNVHLDGMFTVDPRPFAQIDMILIREAEYDAWRAYPKDGIVYHTGNTSADKLLDLPLPAGNYFLIFDSNLPSDSTNSSDTQLVGSEPFRSVRSQIRLTYDRRF
jgi:hypothetical protein